MSEGCNLIFTEKDLQQVEKSLIVEKPSERGQKARNILNGRLRNNVDDLIKILSLPPDPLIGLTGDERYKVVKELLIDSFGRGKVYSDQESKLPSALKTLLKFQKDPSGLFDAPPKQRGPGAEPMKHPYELLSTSAIIQKGKQGVTSSLGTKLKIYPTDRIDFGAKYPARYALQTKKIGTIEADTIIERKSGLEIKKIGIDAKYTKSNSYGSVSHLSRQLDGIQHCFRDGNLHEFHFVTNKQFSPKFKEMVAQKNIDVFKDRMEKDANIRRESAKYLTVEEKNSNIPKKVTDLDLKDNPSILNELAKKYDVPQIGMSEKVNYK